LLLTSSNDRNKLDGNLGLYIFLTPQSGSQYNARY